ncbi:Nodulation protein S (Methyltransferase) [Bradyrhizobium sp. ORS 285]|uniref:SAM-dependent methyltransferase n=1 Tax=Bradyrhizobium sp. ORS 285 TaxID=115808 RepID=UPI000240ABFE|nr:SAM-dependent methyltransferase [Bradyrhizobium sp. ORS 285]CCA64457.1 Nodulation protein S (Methyltransferase) [Bradyrhizobium sp. ORS 285]CCA64467.1 Nodulation protein S (Methyltransferase) [Bradyrhizobium sp. ORS 285]CCD87681.1 Nodulation protein S (Methyltransferase) [Bradyrhizobium sp. ORS 285]SMX56615.1 Nodulation protein S (Methyltransferase) [Bradyrhizobium sp. ORS 285]
MLGIRSLLDQELQRDDPWRLGNSPFEARRYAHMFRLSASSGRIAKGLELGCAAGIFTGELAPRCERLTVVDIMPTAIARAKSRTIHLSNISWVVSDVTTFSSVDQFDLIVLAEILYYLQDLLEMERAIANTIKYLSPGGRLVFGSARDNVCRRWGNAAGAETMAVTLGRMMIEIERVECRDHSKDEDWLLVSFESPMSGAVA